MTERPDLTELQHLTRESKATSARSQEMLDDPDGVALKEQAAAIRDDALRKGMPQVAAKAQAVLDNLEAKEEGLRAAERKSDAAQRFGVQVIADLLDGPANDS